MYRETTWLLLLLLIGGVSSASAEETTATVVIDGDQESGTAGFDFVRDKMLPCTSVKNQASTNTCWCFATNSFLEAELIRMGQGPVDLSEMFIVRHIYPLKAERYIRRHGKAKFAGGGLTNNVLYVLREQGAVPESVCPGKVGDAPHDQYELDRVLKAMLDAVLGSKTINPAWREAVEGTLDAYLGPRPEEFEYKGERYTPRKFARSLGLKADDYVQLTSYTHRPFYQQVRLELPDNWADDLYWNVTLDELMEIMNKSIAMGYTFVWDGDISERSCKRKEGIAILPSKPWWQKTKQERDDLCEKPEPELEVKQERRQQDYDSFRSTDDHLMHVVGTSHDRLGNNYMVVKDSYGATLHDNEGFVNMSESCLRSKTIAILVHKNVMPADVARRLQLAVD